MGAAAAALALASALLYALKSVLQQKVAAMTAATVARPGWGYGADGRGLAITGTLSSAHQ